uniref:G_PROTEIN_RECEP_F1_2 domain-containing protein n=1 Tax=Panagrellus redivivus TaxID=6233 RepID=A0A7E4W1I7_PANRE
MKPETGIEFTSLIDVLNDTSFNDSAAETAEEHFHHLCPSCRIFAIILYSTLSIVAFIGNSLIVTVILYFPRLRTATNFLILNLAVADLMISIFCMPFSYWHVIIFDDQRWLFGALLCKFFGFLQATAVFLSSWTLVAISFDRFMAIMFVMSPWLRLTRSRAFYLIVVTWVFSLGMALPLFYVNHIETLAPQNTVTCQEDWKMLRFLGDERRIMHTYTSVVFALQYVLPLVVLIITYTFIGIKMWNSKVPGDRRNNQCVVQGRHESVKKMIPMVLMVSALYAGCWAPQNILMNIWIPFDPKIAEHAYILYIWWMSHTLAMFHSIVNPFIYYTQNRRIHEGVKYLLRFFPCIKYEGLHLLEEKKGGARAVRIVNMVAYLPIAGKDTVQSTVSTSG